MKLKDLLKNSSQFIKNKSKEALDWYKNKLKGAPPGGTPPGGTGGPPPIPYSFNNKSVAFPEIGKMVMFYYDPLYKKVLPYYDQYPLVFPIHYYDNGFLGINLHYLPPDERLRLLIALQDIVTDNKYDDKTKLNISYKVLVQSSLKYRGFENCVKKYLFTHVRGGYQEIYSAEWHHVVLLPLQRWIVNPNRRFSKPPPY
jgi:hypothetical protein